MTNREGVTFVIPVHNGAPWLDRVLEAVIGQADGRPLEVLAIEDGSTDGSPAILAKYESRGLVRVLPGPQRGAAAALNAGLHAASHPLVCQVDQDVIVERGWMARLVSAFEDPTVAAAQGYYVAPADAGIWARVMGLDLALRYRQLVACPVDHVCTGNTAYRLDALKQVGLFDETLGYGYDNDVSYRLVHSGFRLVIDHTARSVHCWRDSWWSYLVQQYGFGYGRLDLVAKHRRRVSGDDVSGLVMMLHAPLMAAAMLMLVLAAVCATAGIPSGVPVSIGLMLIAALAAERLVAGVHAAIAFGDPAGLWFVPIHLMRDFAWVAAMSSWSVHRAGGGSACPSRSMRPRHAAAALPERRS